MVEIGQGEFTPVRGVHREKWQKLFLKTFTADHFADDGAEFESVLSGVLDDLIHGEGGEGRPRAT